MGSFVQGLHVFASVIAAIWGFSGLNWSGHRLLPLSHSLVLFVQDRDFSCCRIVDMRPRCQGKSSILLGSRGIIQYVFSLVGVHFVHAVGLCLGLFRSSMIVIDASRYGVSCSSLPVWRTACFYCCFALFPRGYAVCLCVCHTGMASALWVFPCLVLSLSICIPVSQYHLLTNSSMHMNHCIIEK